MTPSPHTIAPNAENRACVLCRLCGTVFVYKNQDLEGCVAALRKQGWTLDFGSPSLPGLWRCEGCFGHKPSKKRTKK